MRKFRKNTVDYALLIAWVAGALDALLLARLVARLFAARPDSPAIQLLYAVTSPLVAPLAALNYDQPPYGAALEFATLIMATFVPLLAYLTWAVLRRAATQPQRGPS